MGGRGARLVHRFWVPAELLAGDELELPVETARQVSRVLRLRSGDELALFCGDGEECRAVLREVGPRGVSVGITGRFRPDTELSCRLHLAVAVLKGEKLEWVVQKATELGISKVTFLSTERTVAEPGAERWIRRRERYERIAREAAEQSGRVCLPEIGEPRALREALEAEGPRLILAPGGGRTLLDAVSEQIEGVTLLVGPEGGFTEGELALAREAGAEAVALGRRVLRAETAAIVAVALAAARAEAAS